MSKEYIDKEAAIRNVCRGCGLFDTDNCICTGSVRCDEYDAILDMPPANVKPVVRGEWIFGVSNNIAWMKCSNCLKSQEATGVFAFCPNCGADMKGE